MVVGSVCSLAMPKIQTDTDRLELIGPPLLEGENKFQNGFEGRMSSPSVHWNPVGRPDHRPCGYHAMPGNMAHTKEKFEGGVVGGDDCLPLRAKACVKIVPAPSVVT